MAQLVKAPARVQRSGHLTRYLAKFLLGKKEEEDATGNLRHSLTGGAFAAAHTWPARSTSLAGRAVRSFACMRGAEDSEAPVLDGTSLS